MVKSNNKNINKVNFNSKSKEELSEMNSGPNKNKSEGAQRRWLRNRYPDLYALMQYYKDNDTLSVMERYMVDNETFMKLYAEATSVEEKRKIFKDYMDFRYKTADYLIGKKSNIKAEANVNMNIDMIIKEWRAKNYTVNILALQIIEKNKEEWTKKFGEEQATEMIYTLGKFGKGFNKMVEDNYHIAEKMFNGEKAEWFDSAGNLQRIKADVDKEEQEKKMIALTVGTGEQIIKQEIKEVQEEQEEQEIDEEDEYEDL